jgi:hypothetical protein
MKKLSIGFIAMALFAILWVHNSYAQLSGTKTIPGDYATISAAVADLNLQGVGSGGVTFNIFAGYTETLTSAIKLTTTGTQLNPVIFQKNGTGANPLITAYTGTSTPGSAAPDGIWILQGSDYVTIDGIDLYDPNTTNPAIMEFGYGLFKNNAADGCLYVTIKNCVITLNRNNTGSGSAPMVDGSVGILVINSIPTAATTALIPTSSLGTNSYNKFYANTIQNCHYGIVLYGYGDVSPFTLSDTGNDIGGSSVFLGNRILNFGGGLATSTAGIRATQQWGLNISYNTINNNDGSGVNHTSTLRGIYAQSGASASVNINNNTITLKSAATTSQVSVIENGIGSTAAGNTVNINNNLITNCTNDNATTSTWYGLYNFGVDASYLNISKNTFLNNTTKATSGSVNLICNNGSVASSINIDSNNLSHGFNGSAAYTATFYGIYNSGATTNTNLNIIGNNFSNFNFGTFTNSGTIYFINNTKPCANNNYSNNVWNGLNLYHTGTEYLISNGSNTQVSLTVNNNRIVNGYTRSNTAGTMYCYYSMASSLGTSTQAFSGNDFSNITANVNGTGSFYGIYTIDGSASPCPLKRIYNNTLNNITYKGSGTSYLINAGYLGDGSTTSGSGIYNNTLSNFTDSAVTYGIYVATNGPSPNYPINVYGNNVNNIYSFGTSSAVYGVNIAAGAQGLNCFKNKIYNIISYGTTALAYGIYTLNSFPFNIYNNYIGNVAAQNSSPASAPYLAAAGIYLYSGTNTNVVYNTVYMVSSSTGTNYSSAAVYARTSVTNLLMQNNIFVNLGTPKGAGFTTAFQQSAVGFTYYNTASNNNLFYAGTPSSNRLIYYDGTNALQTLSSYKTFSSRDGMSISENPNFMSTFGSDASYLHIDTSTATQIESGGTTSSVLTVADDYDGQARYPNAGYPNNPSFNAFAPDMGADEFGGKSFSIASLIFPSNNQTCVPLDINLKWSKTAALTTYQVMLAADSLFTNIILNDSTLTDTLKPVTYLTPLTNYYWKVRGLSTSGVWTKFTPVNKFRTIGPASQVVLYSPANGSIDLQAPVSFFWSNTTDQMKFGRVYYYWFEYSQDNLFTTSVIDTTLTDTTTVISGLSGNHTYYWRVKAKNNIGWSSFSDVWSFTTAPNAPGNITLISPANNSVDLPSTVTFNWTKAIETVITSRSGSKSSPLTVSNYWLEYSSSSSFTTSVIDSSLTDTVKTVSGLNMNTKYYWRVKAKNQTGWGNYSDVWNFTTLGPLTGIKTIPGDYATITAAVSDLNSRGVGTGGVIFNVASGYTETLVSAIKLNATGTNSNPITFRKNGTGANPLVTAYTGMATPMSAVPDGIWILNGSDYITIDGIDLLDPNTTNPATMEFGYGLFKNNFEDGCRNVTIKNCTITLSRINNDSSVAPMPEGSTGILVINAASNAATTAIIPADSLGSNSFNRFYSNIIQNCNYGIVLSGYADVSPFLYADTGNDIGGSSSSAGNTIINFGGGNAGNPSAGIRTIQQWGLNVSYNTINNNNGAGVNHAATLRGIYTQSGTSANVTINNNTITLNSATTVSQVSAIENGTGATAAGNTVNINNNTITNCSNDQMTTGLWYGIYNNGANASFLNISKNTFTGNVSKSVSGSVYLIYNTGNVESAINIDSNNLSFGFNNNAAYTATMYNIYNAGSTVNTNCNIYGNNFSNYSFGPYANNGTIYFIYNNKPASNNNYSSNTWTGLNLNHTGTEYLINNSSNTQVSLIVKNNKIINGYTRSNTAGSMYCYYSFASSLSTVTQVISGNDFSNITANVNGTGTFYGIYTLDGTGSPYPKKTVFDNNLSNIIYKASGNFYGLYIGILGDGTTTSGSSIYNNTVSNILDSCTTYGFNIANTNASPNYPITLYKNNVNNLTSLNPSAKVYAYYLGAGTAGMNFYDNKGYNISANGATGVSYGIYTQNSNPYNFYNNYVGDIRAPYASQTSSPYVCASGIYLNSGSNVNVIYNTVYLNTSSTGTNFTSNAVYASTSITSLNMQNNIFVNLSVPKGSGYTAAYQRSSNTILSYAATSNNNLFYAGTPATKNVIYYDGTNSAQTLSSYKIIASGRDGMSITENPNFLSTTGSDANYLHIDPSIATQIESGGLLSPLISIADDYDGHARYPNTGYPVNPLFNPYSSDIGADEFGGISLSAPALISPANNSIGNPSNLNLVWAKSQLLTTYNVILASDSLFANIIVNDSTVTDTLKAVTGLNTLTTYYWKVRGKGASDIWTMYSGIYNFKTLGSASQVALSSPANGSSNMPVNITFNWYKAVDQTLMSKNNSGKNINTGDQPLAVTNYWFEYGTDSTFAIVTGRDSTISDTTHTVLGLSNNTKYYWRVKAKNQIGWNGFSEVWNFTTIVPVPASPAPINPVNNSTGNPLSLNLVWSKPQFAAGYNVILASDPGFINIIINDSTLTDTLKAITNLNPLTTYYWKVRAKDVAGWSAFSSIYNFKTIGTAGQVVLSSPANGTSNQPTTITFNWYKTYDQTMMHKGSEVKTGNEGDEPFAVTNYWFEYSTDSTFATIAGRDTTLIDTTKTVSGLVNNTKYYWRVKAKNQLGWNIFSQVWNFTTVVAIPGAPVLSEPANGATGVPLTPAMSWNSVQYASTYRLQISTDTLFTTPLWDTAGISGLTVTVPTGKLTYGVKYYWRVNASNASGTSSYSARWSFTTITRPALSIKVFLEGFYKPTTGTQVNDTIKVYLADSTQSYAMVDSATIVLNDTGKATVSMNRITGGKYFIVIKHRNHLETWSKYAVNFTLGNSTVYDFTTAATQAYGNNMKQVGSVWVLFGGDANHDGDISALDIPIFISQFGTQGYLAADLNGDGDVNGLDAMILVANFGISKIIPTFDIVIFQNPDAINKKREEIQKQINDKIQQSKNQQWFDRNRQDGKKNTGNKN